MWFKKKDTQPKQQLINTKPGFFSTEWNPINGRLELESQLKKSLQKTAQNFIRINETGVAMDSGQTPQDYPTLKFSTSSIGTIPDAQLSYFAGQGFIGYQTAAILSQNWLIDKACTMPAKDASRNGYEITVNDGDKVKPDILSYIVQKDKEFNILPNCVEFVRMGRIFGIRIAMFLVDSDDEEYYLNPFNPDGIKPGSYKGISQIDPYWIAPILGLEATTNPSSKDFYTPTWWLIQVNNKNIRVHSSHLIIFTTGELPDILKPSYLYGGIPIPQKIVERVYAAERTANEAPLLAMTKRLITYKADLTQAVADQEQFEAKLTYFTQLMNNFGLKVIGGEEEIEQFDTSLAELDAVIMTQYQIVAAASNVPATKLLGTSPKGFNATGEFEEASYHEELESIQQHDLSPLVERHHLLLMYSEIIPKFGIKAFSTEVNWNPVDSPTAAELADINLKKSQSDSQYVNIGALDGVDVRNRLIIDKDSGFNGIEAITETLNEEQQIEVED